MTKKELLKEIYEQTREYLEGYTLLRGSESWKKERLEHMYESFKKMIDLERKALSLREENNCNRELVMYYASFSKWEDVPDWFKESCEYLKVANEIWLDRY